jgi:acylpyruvate hydrolase
MSRWTDDKLVAAVEIDGLLIDLSEAGWIGESPVTVRSILQDGDGTVDAAIAFAEDALNAGRVAAIPVGEADLGPVIPDPQKIICVGANYRAHLEESDYPAPPYPEVFAKYANALIGPGTPIPVTDLSSQLDYEGELAIVIGRTCKAVREEDVPGVIAGYSVVNDISARDVQLRVSQWVVGKTFDGFAPIGPGLVPASAISDPQNLRVVTRLNGEVMQDSNTSYMIFDIRRIVSFLSESMTLVPGDIICTGTPGGVGLYRDPPVFLGDGDVIEVEIDEIGLLSNPVRRAPVVAHQA